MFRFIQASIILLLYSSYLRTHEDMIRTQKERSMRTHLTQPIPAFESPGEPAKHPSDILTKFWETGIRDKVS